jgi:hypothetical protein
MELRRLFLVQVELVVSPPLAGVGAEAEELTVSMGVLVAVGGNLTLQEQVLRDKVLLEE